MAARHQSIHVDAFNQDAVEHGGYLYTTHAPLSSRLAHRRISRAIFQMVDFRGRTVLDIGCGDGKYTLEVLGHHPSRLHGSDLADAAVRIASHKPAATAITFDVASAYQLPFAPDSHDIAHLRAVLHHMDHPQLAIAEAFRVARKVVIAEPNGNNPGVKLFERLSAYHRQHQEKSYSSIQLNRWVREAGGTIAKADWIGLVPTFCPDWIAMAMRRLEPRIEAAPLLSMFACAIYVLVAERGAKTNGTRP